MAGRATRAAIGIVMFGAEAVARADGVVYDDEAFREVETRIVVQGVDGLGDVLLVVYPYPCAASGAFTALEAAIVRDPDAALEGPEEGRGRGYLVVREGQAFPSESEYEGPYNQCYFFGLPRAAFPERDGAIARLDAMSDGARWRLFSRDPSVLRSGVPLAMDGLVRHGDTARSREVTYAASVVDGRLTLEATRWTWTRAGGKPRQEDPRRLAPARIEEVEPHADRESDDEAPWFAGALAQAGGAEKTAGGTGGGEAEKMAEGTGGGGAKKMAEGTGGDGAAATRGPVDMSDGAGPEGQDEASAAAPGAAWWDSRAWYGVSCLAVALAAGLLLRRGR